MNKKPSSCAGCPLEHCGVGFVPPEINTVGGVMLVGEAPGIHAAQSSRLFEGNAGKHLNWLLSLKGMKREDFSLATILSCSPPDKVIPPGAIYHCSKNLDAAIDKAKPKVIVALGTTALKTLTGVDGGVDRLRGFILNSFRGVPVVGTYHPSYLQPRKGEGSTSHHIPLVVRDLLLAKEIAAGTYTPVPFTIWEDPSPMEVDQFIREYEHALTLNPDLALACDIETPYKLKAGDEENYVEVDTTITRVSFGYEAGRAISIPWSGAWMPQIKRLFGSAGRKWWWNGWTFDVPIIEDAGVTVAGRQEDMMWAFHLLQPDLRYGLEKVASIYCPDLPPWKHENSSRPAYYSGMDSVALWRIGEGVERELRKCGMWELYQKHRVKVSPVLREAGRNGIRIDARARRALYKKLRREEKRLLADIQPLVPPSLYPRKRYKKFPTIWVERRSIEHVKVSGEIKVCGNCGTPVSTAAQHVGKKGGKKGIPLNPCYKAKVAKQPGMVTHYDVVMDFNPLSVAQLMTYVEYFRHPVGTHRVTKNPTLDDNHLEKLVAKYGEKHPIYALVQELRTVRKTISTYVVGLRPDDRGVVTTEYGFRPATGRLSSKGIVTGEDKGTNLQNCFDAETEILTERGWVQFPDLLDTDKVAQYHPEDLGISFVSPSNRIDREYSGEMITFNGPRVDLCVTPDHRVITKSRKGVWRDNPAQTFVGKPLDNLLLPHAGFRQDGQHLTAAERKSLQAAIIYQAEGYHVRKEVTVRGERKIAQLKAAFPEEWKSVGAFGKVQVNFYDKQEDLAQWLHLPSKVFKAGAIIALSREDLEWFISEVHKWDGDNTRGYTYLQRNDRRGAVDVVQIAALLSGQSTSIYKRSAAHTTVNMNKRPLRHAVHVDVGTIAYSGRVYCVTVPTGMIVVRRNGQAIVSGNCPHRDDHPYADDIRRMIVPFKGMVFVEADSSSIEAVMTGHFMGDDDYMALAQKGIHSYVACKSLGLEFTPENVKLVKSKHKGLYDRKKRVNHGVNYGMSKWLMTALYPSLFPTPQAAQKEIDELYKLLPKLRNFHHSVRVRAAKDTYLVSPWGYRRYFYDVFRYKKDKDGNAIIDMKTGLPKIELGEDGKSVIAQLPQNGAAAFMLDNVLGIAKEIKAIGGALPGNFLIHDSYCICVPPDKVDEAVEILVKYLTRPIPELNNIRIGCEVKVGTDWGPGMKTVRNVEANG